MEQQNRQRVVGGLLLVFMGVLLAPLLFRSPDEVRIALDLAVPEPPVPMKDILPDPVTPHMQSELERRIVSDQAQLDTPDTPGTDSEQVTKPEQIQPRGWAVQVGSFQSRENAQLVVSQLQDAEYRAFIRQGSHAGSTVYRVLVGPEVNKDRAERTLSAIADDPRFKYKGMLVPFTL